MLQPKRILILSDDKPGHLNQSIAFARHLGCEFTVCRVAFRNRFWKALSYLADRCRLPIAALFQTEPITGTYSAVVSTGSGTYYANRVLANKLGCKAVAIMLPKGYRYAFDLILAQQHDAPPVRENIICLPINLTYVEPAGVVVPESGRKYVAVIVGGDSPRGKLAADLIRKQLTQVFQLFPDYDFWLTTSRRTSAEVEAVLREFLWSQAVYFSQQQGNPIADFIAHSDYLFLTADSSSMISESVSYGDACVEILPLAENWLAEDKIGRLIASLQKAGALHLFDGSLAENNRKINLAQLLQGIEL